MRIAMPLSENKEMDSRISPHFGHAGFMAVYDSESKELEVIRIEEVEGCSPVIALKNLNVDAIYCFGIGMRAISLCKSMGIKLKTGEFGTVREVIKNLNSLKDLEESCGH